MVLIIFGGSSAMITRTTQRDELPPGPSSLQDHTLFPITGPSEDLQTNTGPPPLYWYARVSPETEPNSWKNTDPLIGSANHQNTIPSLEDFRRGLGNGRSDQIVGVWVEDILAFKVSPGVHSSAPVVRDTAAIYNWADDHGVTALLIHNYLGGTRLYHLNPGEKIAAIYGDGGVDWYVVRNGTWYETRHHAHSGFKGPFRIWSCQNCDFDISVRDIRWRHYSGTPHLAFQTCVETAGRVGFMIVDAYFIGSDTPNNSIERHFFMGNWPSPL